ncbi:MAG: beta-galactosidase family protein, partial [Acidobacteriaceae bacterium]
HYPRIPRAYWRARFKMAKAMGLNTITTYVFWNVHEPTPGVYDFSGNNDVAEYIREAQEEGLYVILRPGPYVCAEWEFGGYPAWLLKDSGMVIRSTDPAFLATSQKWLNRLGRELVPLLAANGGPILAVQVENEYGDFGSDHAYMQAMYKQFVDAGFGKALLYTGDPVASIPNGSLPGVFAAVNFGPGHARKAIARLHLIRPTSPTMVGEYWDGWFDHWGNGHSVTDAKQQAEEVEWMLKQGYSISIYMFNGGTSFGWMNGANSKKDHDFRPDVTSYDYDAALSESGRTTPKYFLFRDAIQRATGVVPPVVPTVSKAATIAVTPLSRSVSLWNNLPTPIRSTHPLTMEQIDQAYGYILYRTHLQEAVNGELHLEGVHDYARIYLDGKLVGTVDRRISDAATIPIDAQTSGARLDILVENMGRINFTVRMRTDRKGLLGDVTLAGQALRNWTIYPLPMEKPGGLHFAAKPCVGPCFYRAEFQLEHAADTFLDTRKLVKGEAWINGKMLGRFWNIGPQQTLYVPGSWLHAGKNEIVIFDLDAKPGRTIQGLDQPLLGEPILVKPQ